MQSETFTIGETPITLEWGHLARQASGAVLLRQGRTALLATVTAAATPSGADFLPLTVEYRERAAAAGRIPGNFFRRETRPGEHEVLVSRLVDRSLRPLFPAGFTCQTDVQVTVHSAEPGSDPASLAILAASAALQVSDLPLAAPVAGLRLLRRGGRLVLLPGDGEERLADLDLVVSVTPDGLVMVEGEADGVAEADVLAALDAAAEALAPALETLARMAGPKRAVAPPAKPLLAEVAELVGDEVAAAVAITTKADRRAALAA
ncbi:MAG: polyribonucleotide nucleotidyltransferase, partial [Myxococcales bacterium]|nr:polyribonucleotide nucleotidyltransferase [Myxococcales bacterium]